MKANHGCVLVLPDFYLFRISRRLGLLGSHKMVPDGYNSSLCLIVVPMDGMQIHDSQLLYFHRYNFNTIENQNSNLENIHGLNKIGPWNFQSKTLEFIILHVGSQTPIQHASLRH